MTTTGDVIVKDASDARRYAAKVCTPFAVLGLRTNSTALTGLSFLPLAERAQDPVDRIAETTAQQIERYVSDPGFRFTVPLAPAGTPFRQRVWTALMKIPRGETWTYGEMARILGSAPRAIGGACGANPIALIIPCHRIIGAQGALGGFMNAQSGDPIAIKRWLLTHEDLRLGA
ncbi:MAG: methylated-DNA--[protein]-cysteine S-methyltransferase [Betaproteobacteria bacterium]